METRKQAILAALDSFVAQRSGMDFANYGDVKSYRSEQRSITRDLHDYRDLLDYRAVRQAVALRDSVTADMILEASRSAFSGRLTIRECQHGDKGKVTCGANPKHVWCELCDPAPSALCHWCHGRWYSDAKPGALKITVENEILAGAPRYQAKIDYCTGQYFPTEYRKAATAVLASALWYWTREHAMPAPIAEGKYPPPALSDSFKFMSAGDWLRANFVREFGRGIASRYFN